jgi:hypothetical protein
MVLPEPVAEMVTLFPETGLLNWSFKVMVMVEPDRLSTVNRLGEAETVETLADTAPTVNVTVTVLVNVMLSVVSVAETVFVSDLVDLILAVV